MTAPVILHIPHASRVIPLDTRSAFVLSDEDLEAELIRMTDAYTDELFDLAPHLARKVVFPVSRLVVDPERFADDAEEPMSARGMGVVYAKTSTGQPLRRPITTEQRAALIERYYDPHHEELAGAVRDVLAKYSRCLVIDCHSFPSSPLPYEPDQERPDICIGSDDFHTPEWLTESALDLFRQQGYRVILNRPYSGTIVPRPFYRTERAVCSIMVEVNRSLYMDEASGKLSERFEDTRGRLRSVLEALISKTVP